jgi:hypothetical protein
MGERKGGRHSPELEPVHLIAKLAIPPVSSSQEQHPLRIVITFRVLSSSGTTLPSEFSPALAQHYLQSSLQLSHNITFRVLSSSRTTLPSEFSPALAPFLDVFQRLAKPFSSGLAHVSNSDAALRVLFCPFIASTYRYGHSLLPF